MPKLQMGERLSFEMKMVDFKIKAVVINGLWKSLTEKDKTHLFRMKIFSDPPNWYCWKACATAAVRSI